MNVSRVVLSSGALLISALSSSKRPFQGNGWRLELSSCPPHLNSTRLLLMLKAQRTCFVSTNPIPAAHGGIVLSRYAPPEVSAIGQSIFRQLHLRPAEIFDPVASDATARCFQSHSLVRPTESRMRQGSWDIASVFRARQNAKKSWYEAFAPFYSETEPQMRARCVAGLLLDLRTVKCARCSVKCSTVFVVGSRLTSGVITPSSVSPESNTYDAIKSI